MVHFPGKPCQTYIETNSKTEKQSLRAYMLQYVNKTNHNIGKFHFIQFQDYAVVLHYILLAIASSTVYSMFIMWFKNYIAPLRDCQERCPKKMSSRMELFFYLHIMYTPYDAKRFLKQVGEDNYTTLELGTICDKVFSINVFFSCYNSSYVAKHYEF